MTSYFFRAFVCYWVHLEVTCKNSEQNLKNLAKFLDFKILWNSDFASLWHTKIAIICLILKLQDSYFTCKPDFIRRNQTTLNFLLKEAHLSRTKIFSQHAASIYGFVRFVLSVKKKFRQLRNKVLGWALVCWLLSQIYDQLRCYMMHHASCIMHHASCIMHHASCIIGYF